LPPFAPEERQTKYRDRLNRWWKKMWSQKDTGAMGRIGEETHADQARLFAVFAERKDGLELADCLVRYYENFSDLAHYTGFCRGYKVGLKVGKDEREEAIIKVIRKRPTATPKEMCELIDKHNSRFEDLNDRRRIYLKWPELRKQYSRWVDAEHIPKVKNYLVRIRKKAKEISRIQSWESLMDEHESNRRPAPKTRFTSQSGEVTSPDVDH
jgi:hypothetical protein